MKIKKIDLTNFRSIQNSGSLWMQNNDGIVILAGQNESGKSSILKLLYAFETQMLDELDIVNKGSYPTISITFNVDSSFDYGDVSNPIVDRFIKEIRKLKEITIVKSFTSLNSCDILFDEKTLLTIEASVNDSVSNLDSEMLTLLLEETDSDLTGLDEESIEIELGKEYTLEALTHTFPEEVAQASEHFFENCIHYNTPRIVMFDERADLLPGKIYINDLINYENPKPGLNAVRNLEKILGINFLAWLQDNDRERGQSEEKSNKVITADFNEYWSQKISVEQKTSIKIQYGKDDKGGYLNFYVITKEGTWLSPLQRSDGFKWFLSFYLELRASSNNKTNFLLLFDEPGLFLHSNAQADMLKVFEELRKNHQIIYATHSPYLIQEDKLNRVRLIFNDNNTGTTIGKITDPKSKKKDTALKPIIDAMGIKLSLGFNLVKPKNVILEGISDYYYFEAFRKLTFFKDEDIAFLPSMGAPNMHLLMELCIGWGLEWMLIFDNGRSSTTAINKIKKSFFPYQEDSAFNFIHVIKDADGIEDLFQLEDLCLYSEECDPKKYDNVKKFLTENGGKELVARLFLERVNEGLITLDILSDKVKSNFEELFMVITERFK